jgi:hypothetical protein
MVVQRQGQRPAERPWRCCATMGCGYCWWATDRATSKILSAASRRECGSTSPAALPEDCHELGITIHGTFILGLPGETGNDRGDDPFAAESIRTRSESPLPLPIPAPTCIASGRERLARPRSCRADRRARVQIAPLQYPHLSHTEIFHRSKPSTNASTFVVRRSLRSSPRW